MASAVQFGEDMDPHEIPLPSADPAVNRQRLRWGFAIFAAMALFFLWQEHRAHLLGALPWLFLLACPLMHRFMHHGHGSHARTQIGDRSEKQGEKHGEHEHAGHGY